MKLKSHFTGSCAPKTERWHFESEWNPCVAHCGPSAPSSPGKKCRCDRLHFCQSHSAVLLLIAWVNARRISTLTSAIEGRRRIPSTRPAPKCGLNWIGSTRFERIKLKPSQHCPSSQGRHRKLSAALQHWSGQRVHTASHSTTPFFFPPTHKDSLQKEHLSKSWQDDVTRLSGSAYHGGST